MAVTKLIKIVALLLFAGFVAAAPFLDLGDSSVAQCHNSCQLDFTECLRHQQGADFCRNLVCGYYGNKCQTCQPCGSAVSASYKFTAIANAASEDSTEIVKRQTSNLGRERCVLLCYRTICYRRCFNKSSEMPNDLDGALVLEEASLNSGTVSIKIENSDASSKDPQCIQWVCVFGKCDYVKCKDNVGAEAVAHLASLEMLVEKENAQTLPEGCRKVCKENTDRKECFELCAPADTEKRSVNLTARGRCQRHCLGKTCWTVCYPPFGAEDSSEKHTVELASRGQCQRHCWGKTCWVVCYPPFRADDSIDRRAVQTSSDSCDNFCNENDPQLAMCVILCAPPALLVDEVEERDVGLAPRAMCQRHCLGKTCWIVCYPPFRAEENVARA
ncbi:hypothetical protein BKA66DRAFT_436517 [Pyrenochaeta sp. MPI-SDFR-AT-0127]|nr:hypothetical protein BKA66DRAFT_436517 [Pyrenochaeta sp. MPI-SDFR-AT-0127]